jgi:ligand-binding sensor domain-containing protein/tRNA A-37 threonylcarbamoyl transferase component Bud32
MSNLVGQTFGAYKLVELIGRGGMATVYKAYQPAVDRYVAVKVLPHALQQDPAFAQRFEQEARLIAHLEHPHILPVYDFGVSGDYSYIAMRYLPGGSLKELIALHGALPLPRVAQLFYQVADALDYAHSQGVIHRDVKPSNVLLDQRGDAFLSDFGIAKIVAGSAQVTGTAIIGTPAYMSPEQAMGAHLDGRSDVYALGVMLYELLVGRVPFDAETPMSIILKHLNEPAPLPSASRGDLPDAVEQVVLRAMAKSAGERFATAGAMSQALAEALGAPATFSPRPVTRPVEAGAGPALPVEPDGATLTVLPPRPAEAGSDGASAAGGQAAAEKTTQRAGAVPAARRLPAWAGRAALFVVGLAAIAALLVFAFPGLLSVPGQATPVGTPGPTPFPTRMSSLGPGQWANYGDANRVRALAAQGGVLWAAGPGGLVRWDVATGAATTLTAADGLPANDLVDVLAASDGTLWLAANGRGVIALDPQNPAAARLYTTADGLGSDNITRLYEDTSGTVWAFGRGRGAVNRFDGQAWTTVALPETTGETPAVRAAYREPDGTLWLATAGAGLVRVRDTAVRTFTHADGLPSDEVTALLPAGADTWWIGTTGGAVRLIRDKVTPVGNTALAVAPVSAILRDTTGALWFGTGGGLYRLDPVSGEWSVFGVEQGLPNAQIVALAEEQGVIWAATGSGLAHQDGAGWTAALVAAAPPVGQVVQIMPWGEALLLRGADGDGLVRMRPPAGAQAEPIYEALAAAASVRRITALAAAPDGTLYLGTAQGVLRLDPNATEPLRLSGLPEPTDVTALAVALDGSVWVGTSGGLSRYDQGAWRQFRGAGAPPQRPIVALAAGPDGVLWVAWANGLARFTDGDWDVWEPGGPFGLPTGLNGITALFAGEQRQAWAGTQSGTVLQYSSGAWNALTIPGDESWAVLALAAGPGGVLWVGLDGGGVARFDGRDWVTAGASDGLGDDTVAALYAAPAGDVWFATSIGLAHWAPEK